jgi:hypothetical protein
MGGKKLKELENGKRAQLKSMPKREKRKRSPPFFMPLANASGAIRI